MSNLKFVCLKTPLDEFLSKEDVDYYKNLKRTLSSHICRNCRNRRIESFNEILSTIHYYITRKKEDSWKRSLICGVCWYKNYIVVNIRQMSYLLDKCKSSINGSLQRLCFIVLPDKQQSLQIIIEAIPYLKNHPDLIQTWSVRQHIMPSQSVYQFNPFYQFYPIIYQNVNQFIPQIKVNNNLTIDKTNVNTKIKKNINKNDKKVKLEQPIVNDVKIEMDLNKNTVNSDKNIENKIRNSSSSGFFSNLFDDAEVSDGLFDKYNLF